MKMDFRNSIYLSLFCVWMIFWMLVNRPRVTKPCQFLLLTGEVYLTLKFAYCDWVWHNSLIFFLQIIKHYCLVYIYIFNNPKNWQKAYLGEGDSNFVKIKSHSLFRGEIMNTIHLTIVGISRSPDLLRLPIAIGLWLHLASSVVR